MSPTSAPSNLSPIAPSRRDWPVKTVTQREDLAPAIKADHDAAIWQRTLPEPVQSWLGSVPGSALPRGRYILVPEHVRTCMRAMFDAAGQPDTPAQAWLCEDAARLATHLRSVEAAELIRLRLEPISDNACAKFHIDTVTARLICTYRGPGTQITLDELEGDPVCTVDTGAPILLKGKLWPQLQGVRLKHRSPPIEGTGLTRLVMVLEATTQSDILPTYDTIFRP